MFMTMFAQECYARFNALSIVHFSTTPWKLSNGYKNNAVRVWQQLNEYQGQSSFNMRLLNLLSEFTFRMALFACVTISMCLLFMSNPYFWADYLYGEGVYVILLLLVASYIVYLVLRRARARTLG